MTSAQPTPVKLQALTCPNCGGQVELRGFANTLTVACHPLLDSSRYQHASNSDPLQVPEEVKFASRSFRSERAESSTATPTR